MIHTNCKIIGLTGGIASGKSTVSKILKQKGYTVIDADIIAREIVKVNRPAYKEIIEYFGPSIRAKDKSINRQKLGEIVFSDKGLLQKLNDITHPYIFQAIKKDIKKYCNSDIIFLDIPLLIEEFRELKKHGIYFDEIWLVYVDEGTQLERLVKRNKFTIDEAKSRIHAQMPMKDKINQSTRIIDNTGSKRELKTSIESLLKDL